MLSDKFKNDTSIFYNYLLGRFCKQNKTTDQVHMPYKKTMKKTLCVYCASDKISFVDFAKVNKRLNDKQIAVTEIWVCKNCSKEFERVGILYSPDGANLS